MDPGVSNVYIDSIYSSRVVVARFSVSSIWMFVYRFVPFSLFYWVVLLLIDTCVTAVPTTCGHNKLVLACSSSLRLVIVQLGLLLQSRIVFWSSIVSATLEEPNGEENGESTNRTIIRYNILIIIMYEDTVYYIII